MGSAYCALSVIRSVRINEQEIGQDLSRSDRERIDDKKLSYR